MSADLSVYDGERIRASDAQMGDYFGISVAISGDTVVVGAASDDIGANLNQGSAYVFVKPAGGWADMTQTAKLTASDGAANDSELNPVEAFGSILIIDDAAQLKSLKSSKRFP